MGLQKPFYRIARPFTDKYDYSGKGNSNKSYLTDIRYANNRISLCRAYFIIQNDFLEMLNYIDPDDDNLKCFSHRIYELFLRASTEFESNCKAILCGNGYKKVRGNDFNIKDYYKINKACKLSEYIAYFDTWNNHPLEIKPFQEWESSSYQPLPWYRNYNLVKHDRSKKFKEANLENLIKAISSLYVVLLAQFNRAINLNDNISQVEHSGSGTAIFKNSIFRITFPRWESADHYTFDWGLLIEQENIPPISEYQF